MASPQGRAGSEPRSIAAPALRQGQPPKKDDYLFYCTNAFLNAEKMTQSELIILNFTEIRRRSIKLWNGLPESHYHWKPDEKAMSAIAMVRHVLEADYGWNIIINKGSMANYKTPWAGRPLGSVSSELEFAQPYRDAFLESVKHFSDKDLNESYVIHPGNGEHKALGKYLLRIGYHESVHAGQFLAYLRAMQIERPGIWD